MLSTSGKSQLYQEQSVAQRADKSSVARSNYSGPTSITRNIKKDKNGNIWFASWQGIFKYDGHVFTNITSEISLNRFFSVLIDSKGHYWFGSIGSGAYHYDGQSFRNLTTKEGLANDSVLDIYEDKKGHIWFATEAGASRYDGTSFTNFTTKEGLPDMDLNAIIEDNTGNIWFASRSVLSIYDGRKFTKPTRKSGLTFSNVRSLIEDKKGRIWLGGGDGLWRYDGQQFTQMGAEFVGYIHEDQYGNIWTSSKTLNQEGWGLTRYSQASWNKEALSPTQIWENEGMIFGVLEDGKGDVWFGTLKGVCRYNGTAVECFE